MRRPGPAVRQLDDLPASELALRLPEQQTQDALLHRGEESPCQPALEPFLRALFPFRERLYPNWVSPSSCCWRSRWLERPLDLLRVRDLLHSLQQLPADLARRLPHRHRQPPLSPAARPSAESRSPRRGRASVRKRRSRSDEKRASLKCLSSEKMRLRDAQQGRHLRLCEPHPGLDIRDSPRPLHARGKTESGRVVWRDVSVSRRGASARSLRSIPKCSATSADPETVPARSARCRGTVTWCSPPASVVSRWREPGLPGHYIAHAPESTG